MAEALKIKNKDINTINVLIEASNEFRASVRRKIEFADDHRITKLELGTAIRKGGANYQYALAHAIASEILESTQRILKLNDYAELIEVIFPNFDSSCKYVAYDLGDDISGFKKTTLSTLCEQTKIGRNCFLDLIEIAHRYDIQNSWALKPILDGNAIKENFLNIPDKKRMSEMMQSQIDWMISNPAGTEKEIRDARVYAVDVFARDMLSVSDCLGSP